MNPTELNACLRASSLKLCPVSSWRVTRCRSSATSASVNGNSEGHSKEAGEKLTFESAARRRKRREVLSELLRVDHAGEVGANFIYKGQLAALSGNSRAVDTVKDMWDHEKQHLKILEELLPKERVRPSLLRPLWEAAGFTLGFATGVLGEKSAMACTDAVEEAIVDHYNDQIRQLLEETSKSEGSNPEGDYRDIVQIISHMRDDEQHHQNLSQEFDSQQAPFYDTMKMVIKTGCRIAIYTAEKI